MGKVGFVVGAAAGYVLGARAGRQRYEQIRRQVESLWADPRVQKKAAQAEDLAREKGSQLQDQVKRAVATSGLPNLTGASERTSPPEPSPSASMTTTPDVSPSSSAPGQQLHGGLDGRPVDA
jgi:hypothetical protein